MHCTPSFLFILLFHQTCRALSKALKRLLFFFIISCSLIKLSSLRPFSSALISHQALISLQSQSQSQSQSRRRRRRRRQPQPSPSHAVNSQLSPLCLTAAGPPEAHRHRPTPLTHSVETSHWPILKSLLWPCRHRPTTKSSSSLQLVIISSSHLPAKPSPSQPSPSPAHAVPAHASAHARRRRQPTSGQCSLFSSFIRNSVF